MKPVHVNIQDVADLTRESVNESNKILDACTNIMPKYNDMLFTWNTRDYLAAIELRTDAEFKEQARMMVGSMLESYKGTGDVEAIAAIEDAAYHTLAIFHVLYSANIYDLDKHLYPNNNGFVGGCVLNMDELGNELTPHGVAVPSKITSMARGIVNEVFAEEKEDAPPDLEQEILSDVLKRSFIAPLVIALKLMNVKRTRLEEQDISRQMRRMLERKSQKSGTEIPLARVIRLHPFSETGKRQHHGYSIRDVVRAGSFVGMHFRTYSPERPLFGKWSGTYLIKPHHRAGRKRKGETERSFEIKLDE